LQDEKRFYMGRRCAIYSSFRNKKNRLLYIKMAFLDI